MLERLATIIKSLDKKDFREIIAWMSITTVYLFMFAIVFVPMFIPMPDVSARFADLILGYMFGSMIKSINEHYFKSDKSSKDKSSDSTDV